MTNIQETVTKTIIEALEGGTISWRKPWVTGKGNGLPTRSNGEPYKGINVMLLMHSQAVNGFESDYWFTYNQAKQMDAQVRKGSKSTMVVYYGTAEKKDARGDEKKTFAFLKKFNVFNADQIEGLPSKYSEKVEATGSEKIAEMETFFNAVNFTLNIGGNRAFYSPSTDAITMPEIERFVTSEAYYGTLAHELVHWTGYKNRLDRLPTLAQFGDAEYAKEELVAELGSVMLSLEIGATPDFEQSAAYIQSWIKALRNDSRFIFKAASKAQKAVDFIKGQASDIELPLAA